MVKDEDLIKHYFDHMRQIRERGAPPDFVAEFLKASPTPIELLPEEILDDLFKRQDIASYAILGAMFHSRQGLTRTEIRKGSLPLLIFPKPEGLVQSTLHRALIRMKGDNLVEELTTKPPRYRATDLGKVLFLGHVRMHALSQYYASLHA